MQHVGAVAPGAVGAGVHFEEEAVGTERPGRPGHGRHELAVASRRTARTAGTLHRMGTIHHHGLRDAQHVGGLDAVGVRHHGAGVAGKWHRSKRIHDVKGAIGHNISFRGSLLRLLMEEGRTRRPERRRTSGWLGWEAPRGDSLHTGHGGGEILDADGKRRALDMLCMLYGLHHSQAIAGGDGANDLEMIKTAGLGFAYHGKPIVAASAPYRVNHGGLDAVINLFVEAWDKARKL